LFLTIPEPFGKGPTCAAKAVSVPITYSFGPESTRLLKNQPDSLPTEELALLRHFKKVKRERDRETVLRVAQLAAKI
jgi:hypothetical protein